MKKCLVVSMGLTTGEVIANQLRTLLSEDEVLIDFVPVTYGVEYIQKKTRDSDFILFTSDVSYMACNGQMKIDFPFIIGARVINHKNIEEVISIPPGTEVLLLNDSEGSAKEVIEQLKELNLDHVIYYPCFPGSKNHPKLATVVTPGEPQFMPSCGKALIDIGTRILDLKTIYAIKEKLGLEQVFNDSLVITYIKDIIGISRSIDNSRQSERESKQVLETIFDTVDSGLAFLSKDLEINKVNSKCQHIFAKNRRDLIGKDIRTIIPNLKPDDLEKDSIHLEIQESSYIINFEKMWMGGEDTYLLTVYAVDKIREMDQSTYGRVITGGLSHLKSFEDYLSIDAEVHDMLAQAEKFAKTDATIAIQGENGTGKEIIAQGIHRHSYRKNKPFVPVNIAAISQNLLESELFGYEKGAFTGASKEGKIGLFEVANGGTLFIDEIGDAPLDIQVKLLRVLQEKKIRRVGGVEEIPVDVRVITATNKDLLHMVDEEKFREDLYFRLNILPLYTTPLRMRPEDINHLLEHFISIYFDVASPVTIDTYFSEETLAFLNRYRWRGNVRELINLVEYLSYLYMGQPFVLKDLPKYYLSQDKKARHLSADELWLLKQVLHMPGCGRSRLSKQAKEEAYDLGEGQIRRLIAELQDSGEIESKAGGRGLFITDRGKALLAKSL